MTSHPDWRSVVTETVKLLKDGHVQPAIELLEELLQPQKSAIISPRKKKMPRRSGLSQSETSVKRNKPKRKTPNVDVSNKPKSKDEETKEKNKLAHTISSGSPNRRTSEPANTPILSTKKFPRKLKKVETMGLIDFSVDPASLRSSKQVKGWGYIVKELYTTERDYIRDVRTMIEVFRDPMLEKGILTSDEASKIFSNIETILAVNGELLKQLESIEGTKTETEKTSLAPPSEMQEDLKKVTAVVNIAIRMEDNSIETKSVDINGLSTFQQCLTSIMRTLPASYSESHELYHENTLITDYNIEVMKYVGYNMNKLNFSYKRDALKNVHTVGGALLNMAHYLKIYSEYCSNQASAIEMLNALKKERGELDSFLRSCLKKPRCRRLDLASFLVMPLQRVCKYPLLLRELISQTPEGHSDYQPLREASKLIGETVFTINEKGREAEQRQVMMDLQNSLDGFKGTIIKPSRKFVAKSDQKSQIKFVNKKGEEIPADFFVFNDILLICTTKHEETGRCRFLGKIKIRNAFVEDVDDMKFQVGRLGKKEKILLAAATEKDKRKATDIIQKQVLRDTYEDWVATEKAMGKTSILSYNDWYASYGKILFG